MAIEGPLRELGIHDVFQLLDLSRKTGTLAVRSELRSNEGTVLFEAGRVVAATIRSNPHRMGDLLVQSGRVTETDIAKARALQLERGDNRRLGEVLVELGLINARELERQVRLQIEAVVFELLSWGEGFFRFEEGPVADTGIARLQISIESLLMEGARRIDEWSRISDRVPSLAAVPQLAPVDPAAAPRLDLLPNEWEVLSMIDGERDLRSMAALLARSEFEVAKVVYGLATTGVVELRVPPGMRSRRARRATPSVLLLEPPTVGLPAVSAAWSPAGPPTAAPAGAPIAAPTGALAGAPIAAPALTLIHAAPKSAVPRAAVGLVEPRAAPPADDLERGFQLLRRGDFGGAVTAWTQYLRAHPGEEWSERVRGGADAARRLHALLEARQGD